MKWVGGTMDTEIASQIAALDRSILQSQAKNKLLEQEISDLTSKLTA